MIARRLDVPRTHIFGAPIAVVDEVGAVAAIVDAGAERRGLWAVTANLDHLRRYRHESLVRDLIDEADLVVADGTPLIWASWVAGTPLPQRIAGSDLIWSVCGAAAQRGVSVFLIGGNPGVAETAAEVLSGSYAGLEIAGTLCPPLGFEDDRRELARIHREIGAADPGIVLVALGFPKQDLLIRDLRSHLPGASFIGIGISFSFVAGELARAPRWIQRLGLEWAYRLRQEPGRLARRYLSQGFPFALRLFASAIRHRLALPDAGQWG